MQVSNATKKIFLILLSLVTFITIVFLYMGHFHHLFVLDTLVKEERSIAQDVYRNTLKQVTGKYELIARNILINEQVIDAFETQDRRRLLELTAPLFKELRENNPYLNIMHFHTKETRSFLRLHKPGKFGDDLSPIRHMINYVNHFQTKQIGMEVGRYGIYYRIALPVFNRAGKYLGAFELGIDINYILNLFNNDYNFSPLLVLKKEVFDIMVEANKDLAYTPLNQQYNLINTNFKIDCGCYTSDIITKPYVIEQHDGFNNLVFKVTDLDSISGEEIGKLLFVKDMGFYLDKITLIRNAMLGAAAVLLLFTFYLLRRIFKHHTRMIKRYQSILEQKNRTLERLTNTDHLTKAYNRRYCDVLLRKEIKRAHRYGEPLSVLLLDIDNFKSINDTFGHNIGDRVLKQVSGFITSTIRETDHFGRWGGEEFIIITPQTAEEQADMLAEKLRAFIDGHIFETVGNVTCSFGIASYKSGQNSESLIHHADTALYGAKENGKNRVVTYGGADIELTEQLHVK